MVRVFGVVSLLFLSHIALVSADVVPRSMLGVKRNSIVEKLFGRRSTCPPHEGEACVVLDSSHLLIT